MSEQQDFATHIADLLEPFRYCEARRMFVGYDIFHHGLMFGLLAHGSLYPKAGPACLHRARLAFDTALRKPSRHKKKKS